MTQQPEKDIATALEAAGLGTMSQSPGPQTIVWGHPLDTTEPGAAAVNLYVFSMGGPGPVPYLGGGVVSDYDATVQVRVRSPAGDEPAGMALARAVRDALHCKPPAGYYDLRADTTDPLYLGSNPSGQHEWSVPFSLRWTA